MNTRSLVLGLALTLMAVPAFAGSCPKDMKQIDAALGSSSLSAAQMEEVKKLRADGEAYHKSGEHKKSVDTLAQAKKMLGIN